MNCLYYYRIPFSEVDAMGFVHHSNHARYFEKARVEHLRLIGLNYLEVTKRGMHFPLTDMSLSFKRPLLFDDIIVIESRLTKLTRVRLQYSYRVLKAETLEPCKLAESTPEGRVLVFGTTDHCCVNTEGRPIEMAADLYEGLVHHFHEEKS